MILDQPAVLYGLAHGDLLRAPAGRVVACSPNLAMLRNCRPRPFWVFMINQREPVRVSS